MANNIGTTIDTILHDIIAAGVLSAAIFVKNPNSQAKAAQLMNAVNSLLPMLDQQLTSIGQSTAPTPSLTTTTTPSSPLSEAVPVSTVTPISATPNS